MNMRTVLADTALHRAVTTDGRLSAAQWDTIAAAAAQFADALRVNAVTAAGDVLSVAALDAALVAYRTGTLTTRYRKLLRAAAASVVYAAVAEAADGVATNLGLDITRLVRRPSYDPAMLTTDIASAVESLSALLDLVGAREVAA